MMAQQLYTGLTTIRCNDAAASRSNLLAGYYASAVSGCFVKASANQLKKGGRKLKLVTYWVVGSGGESEISFSRLKKPGRSIVTFFSRLKKHGSELVTFFSRLKKRGSELVTFFSRLKKHGSALVAFFSRLEKRASELVTFFSRLENHGSLLVDFFSRLENPGSELVTFFSRLKKPGSALQSFFSSLQRIFGRQVCLKREYAARISPLACVCKRLSDPCINIREAVAIAMGSLSKINGPDDTADEYHPPIRGPTGASHTCIIYPDSSSRL